MLFKLLAPRRQICPFCARPTGGQTLCASCRALLADWKKKYAPCPRCGRLKAVGDRTRRGDPAAGNGRICPQCREESPPFRLARAAGPYLGVLKEAIQDFKYNGRRSLAGPLGKLMAEVLVHEKSFGRPEVLIPVPLAPARLQERAFNQAELLAGSLGAVLGLKVQGDVLSRVWETPPQVGLTRRERLANLRGAFRVLKPVVIRGRGVLLVDDVLTTGATASECARVLLAAGAREVSVITVATGIIEENFRAALIAAGEDSTWPKPVSEPG
ncbi:MAG: hypothetical protein PWP65_1335 [Clostridia bacterium]|nr:hypothetical protein [Clostridia bacterium]